MLKEFREFIARGNVLDMAVGIIAGVAFGKIITSLVNDIIMPVAGLLLGKMDFSNLFVNLSGTHYKTLDQAQAAGAATINYGLFINTILDFIIVAFIIFLIVRQFNRLKRKEKAVEPTTRECPFCFSTISLKAVRCPNCTSQIEEAANS